jgi:hypothetical protein
MALPKLVQAKKTFLKVSITDSEASAIVLNRLLDLYGNELTTTDFGSLGWITINPGGAKEEIIKFTTVTQNDDGSATLSGITRAQIGKSPYGSGGTAYDHSAGAIIIVGNNPQIYDAILDYIAEVAAQGAADADETTAGLVEIATDAEAEAGTDVGGTGAPLVVPPSKILELIADQTDISYAADTGTANAYDITPDPLPGAYAVGQIFIFKATNANTGASTLEVGSLGGVPLKKNGTEALIAGDILAGQILQVVYDGTNFQVISRLNVTNNKFGGTGADGALTVSSGTTTIDLGSAAVVVKNYTSISITGTGKVGFSNPHANGTIIILKSQGAVTLTSSDSAMIDGRSMGASSNTDGSLFFAKIPKGTAGTGNASAGAGGGPGGVGNGIMVTSASSKIIPVFTGAGGGASGGGGAGGRGGGGIYIECGGAFNFTTGGVNVSGAQGTDDTGNNLGGAGGGAGGSFVVFYKTLTANTGTITIAGGTGGYSNTATAGGAGGSTLTGGTGTGGAGTHAGNNGRDGGGGGGASPFNGQDGSAGGSAGTADGPGGGGAAGFYLVAANTEFI